MLDPFESYNARFVDPRTVAETFKLRDRQFSLLCEQTNSLLVGPRGSGKTTLLKMLKVGAQVAWKNRRQANSLRRFRFAPIYVGADRQLDFLVEASELSRQLQSAVNLLSKSLLALRVKFACLDTAQEISNPALRDIQNLSHQYVSLNDKEESLCKALSAIWDLGEAAHTFLEVKTRLYWQLSEINRFFHKMKHGLEFSVSNIVNQAQFLTHDPITSCEAFVSIFNQVVEQPDKIWALCLDELEIMPAHLQHYLFSSFRSISQQRIVLKLATSPFSKIDWRSIESSRPMAGNDYTAINLGFTRKRVGAVGRNEARRFSAQLLDALIGVEGHIKRGAHRPPAQNILGRSPITEANTSPEQRDSYRAPDGSHYRRFVQLKAKDVAFSNYLDQRKINLETFADVDENKRAGGARKFIWQVACRLEFGPTNLFRLSDDELGGRPPSRKTIPDIYLGLDSLLTMCEGNPRIRISLLRPMVRRYFGSGKQVPFEEQAVLVQEAVAKFVSLLSTIQVLDPQGEVKNMSIVDLINSIGEYFNDEVNSPSFKPEPQLTFRVDRSVPREYIIAIGSALNQGAFFMLSDESGLFDFGALEKARLRLSYLLCPMYHIPLTYGGEAQLSKILQHKRPRATRRAITQNDLFSRGSL